MKDKRYNSKGVFKLLACTVFIHILDIVNLINPLFGSKTSILKCREQQERQNCLFGCSSLKKKMSMTIIVYFLVKTKLDNFVCFCLMRIFIAVTITNIILHKNQ